jgi:hypothetical protein
MHFLSKFLLAGLLACLSLPANAQWGKDKPQDKPKDSTTDNTQAPEVKIQKNDMKYLPNWGIGANLYMGLSSFTVIGPQVQVNGRINNRLMLDAAFLYSPFPREQDDFGEKLQANMRFQAGAAWFFGKKEKTKEYKIIVRSENSGYRTTTHYYVPARAKQFRFWDVRGGLQYYTGAYQGYFYTAAYPESSGGVPAASEGGFALANLGIGRLKFTQFVADVESYGERKQRYGSEFYFDILLAAGGKFDAVTEYDIDGKPTETPVTGYKKKNVGWQLGWRILPSTAPRFNFGLVLGDRPGLSPGGDAGEFTGFFDFYIGFCLAK